MRVLVCGGRNYNNADKVYSTLDELKDQITTVIHGGAPGADTLAHSWAVTRRKELDIYLADWNKHGRAAGPIRNKEMLEKGEPDLVIALPGGRGTKDMVSKAQQAGIKIITINS